MEPLRIVLLLVGVVLVLAVYGWSRRRHGRQHEEESVASDADLGIENFSTDEAWSPDVLEEGGFSASDPEAAVDALEGLEPGQADEQLFVALTVMAPGEPFQGPALLEAVKSAGLHLGQMKIFHYFPDAEGVGEKPWFGVANVLEPGVFEIDSVSELATPGVVFFLQSPETVDAVTAFDRMVETARRFAEDLGGQLCNERREPLEEAQLEQLRERVRNFEVLAAARSVG